MEYQWFECTKKALFGGCREEKKHIELYDFRDDAVREKLINMNFVGTVRVLP